MSEETTPNILQVGLELTLRPPQDEPTHIMHLPVGGPYPLIVIGIQMGEYDQGKINMELDATGFRDPEMLVEVLEGLVEHMKTTAYDMMDASGVSHVPPMIETEGQGD